MKRNNNKNNNNPNAVPPDLLPESDACRLAHRLQNNLKDTNDKKRRNNKNNAVINAASLGGAGGAGDATVKEKTRIEGPVRRWTPKRVFCCAGWIFCCPFFTMCWALREPPVDEEDLREDDCLPCWSG